MFEVLDATLLTAAQMAQAHRFAIAAGIPGPQLMRGAGEAVALSIMRRWQPCRVLVACGPGNNGGDGFVAAHALSQRGWPVELVLLGDAARLKGDAAWAAGFWKGVLLAPDAVDFSRYDLVVDALFGAGLDRPLEGAARGLVSAINQSGLPVCAVDVPSGVDGSTGAVLNAAVQADWTVTFFCKKPGHLLYPGRGHCGVLELADIGIPVQSLAGLNVGAWENTPAAWRHALPAPGPLAHKYQRGYVLVLGGAALTGAAMLSARAAQKTGAGLVAIAAPASAHAAYAHARQSIMVQFWEHADALLALLRDPRRNTCVLGPGAGVQQTTRQAVLAALQAGKAVVIDADALTVFADEPQALFSAIHALRETGAAGAARVVLTPHEGEFVRLFGAYAQEDKLHRARAAARQAGAVVLLKGADTVVAGPDGRAFINASAPASLASGGTGDVLAGMVAGLLAQGAPALEAAAAAVWLHSQAAQRAGRALVAEDLLVQAPHALEMLYA